MRILVTGGAGFVGSSLALKFKAAHPTAQVVAFDNLRRRGSELGLPRLRAAGVEFHHGDIRCPEDLADAGGADVVLECSAEPSVHAGYGGSPAYLVNTNLLGTVNALEHARLHKSAIVFLSTSRVYPIAGLRNLPMQRVGDRLEIAGGQSGPGWSAHGVSTDFPLEGSRSMYGATKLASELLVEEYREMYGLKAVVNRCGVLTGPWQMGKVDQGFVVLWAARHLFRGQLSYMGFGGEGAQVRDMLHVDDLYELIRLQLDGAGSAPVYNVGGGPAVSASLRQCTALCAERAGAEIEIGCVPETRAADIPWYVTDNRRVTADTGWEPQRSVGDIFDDVFAWLRAHRAELEPLLS